MKLARRATGILILLATLTFVTVPFATTCYHLLTDSGLRSAGPSTFACQLHRSISKKLPGYIEDRIASGKAKTLKPSQITATEWPVYGAFFYLLATENLQRSWQQGAFPGKPEPVKTAGDAIEASVRIMLDEGHAHWVKDYWGDDHLTEPNCFYRMLTIGSLTAHHNLTGKSEHLPLLREITDDLANDIDRSPSGLVDDYPGQCFPADVGVAIAIILHADTAIGTNRKEWARQALDRLLDNFADQLPPYTANDDSGLTITPTRGCTNGFFFSFARDINPTAADALYTQYINRFWQEKWLSRGFREFPDKPDHDQDSGFYIDPDSGPVILGFGTSATGLGLGATRLHDDHHRAGQLAAELITSALPFPNGRLLIPSLVADKEHAPHFPEIVILHQLSLSHPDPPTSAALPPIVWTILGAELILSVLFLRISWKLVRSKSHPRKFPNQANRLTPSAPSTPGRVRPHGSATSRIFRPRRGNLS